MGSEKTGSMNELNGGSPNKRKMIHTKRKLGLHMKREKKEEEPTEQACKFKDFVPTGNF